MRRGTSVLPGVMGLCSAALFPLAACHAPTTPAVDASVDSDVTGDGDVEVEADIDAGPQIEPPAPPALPAPPVLTPCPPGWREVPPEDPTDPYDVTTCDPWPEGGRQDCAAIDEAHFPGEPGCTRIGTSCPERDWTPPPEGDELVLYVRAGDPPGGAGTEASPFGTIAEAMAAATPGTTIALSKGTFDEEVTLAEGVTLWGACVAETLVTCTEPVASVNAEATIAVHEEGVAVRNLRVSGDRLGFRVTLTHGSLHVEDVLIVGTRVAGIWARSGGQLSGRSVVVRDMQPGVAGELDGGGLVVVNATAELSRASFERSQVAGVVVADSAASAALADIAVVDTQSRAIDGTQGYGILAIMGGQVDVRRATLESNREEGVFLIESGTFGSFADVIVRDTKSRESDGMIGNGVEVNSGARAELRRVLLERNRTSGLAVGLPDAEAVLSDVIARQSSPPDAPLGRDEVYSGGISVGFGASIDGVRVLSDRNVGLGVHVDGRDQRVEARFTDLVIRESTALTDLELDVVGLEVDGPALAVVERALIERNQGGGLFVASEDARLSLQDLVVRENRHNDWIALGGRGGGGLMVSYGASVDVQRVRLEGNDMYGITAFNAGTVVQMEDVELRDTRSIPCLETECEGGSFGSGIASLGGAHVELTRFVIADNALCGLQLAYGSTWDGEPYDVGGTIDLHEGVISGNLFGANVRTEEFDITRLMDRVIWRDNFRNIDSTEMPVPDLSPPL